MIVLGALLCGFTCFFPLFQEKVLHNVMSIFTFMGASVVRQDDSYSFEVITKTLDTVIPALIQVCAFCVLCVLTHGMIGGDRADTGEVCKKNSLNSVSIYWHKSVDFDHGLAL